MDPRFEVAVRESFTRDHDPAWMADAACRKRVLPGRLWASMFADEEAAAPGKDYVWSEGTLAAMECCAGCPVRRECLSYAFDHERSEREDRAKLNLHGTPTTWIEDDRRWGVYGGIPGLMRERFALAPDRLERCETWFRGFAQAYRWLPMEEAIAV